MIFCWSKKAIKTVALVAMFLLMELAKDSSKKVLIRGRQNMVGKDIKRQGFLHTQLNVNFSLILIDHNLIESPRHTPKMMWKVIAMDKFHTT